MNKKKDKYLICNKKGYVGILDGLLLCGEHHYSVFEKAYENYKVDGLT